MLSLYAGATNAVLLRGALGQLERERPGARPAALMPAAVERCYEGLASTSVNIVKAAGLASTIALPEAISAVNTIVAEGAGAATMMNLLLVFYFVFVLAVLGLLRAGKGALSMGEIAATLWGWTPFLAGGFAGNLMIAALAMLAGTAIGAGLGRGARRPAAPGARCRRRRRRASAATSRASS